MLQEETSRHSKISSPESTTRLASAPTHPDVDAIQRMEHGSELGWRAQLAVPLAALVALAIHLFLSKSAPAIETHSYALFFYEIIGVSAVLAIAQRFWMPLRSWMQHMCPIFTAAVLSLGLWDMVTFGFRLLPMPYFPGPAAVLRNLINDRALLLDSTWHSLALLLSGYTVGVLVGLISGICIGWSTPVRYWGMPLLKVVGPIPATAWIPLALVVSPSTVV